MCGLIGLVYIRFIVKILRSKTKKNFISEPWTKSAAGLIMEALLPDLVAGFGVETDKGGSIGRVGGSAGPNGSASVNSNFFEPVFSIVIFMGSLGDFADPGDLAGDFTNGELPRVGEAIFVKIFLLFSESLSSAVKRRGDFFLTGDFFSVSVFSDSEAFGRVREYDSEYQLSSSSRDLVWDDLLRSRDGDRSFLSREPERCFRSRDPDSFFRPREPDPFSFDFFRSRDLDRLLLRRSRESERFRDRERYRRDFRRVDRSEDFERVRLRSRDRRERSSRFLLFTGDEVSDPDSELKLE